MKAINVENSFMDEKKAAVFALRAICKHTGPAFLPYLYQSLEETWKLLEFPESEVRKSAVEAVTEFTVAYFKVGMGIFTGLSVKLPVKLNYHFIGKNLFTGQSI